MTLKCLRVNRTQTVDSNHLTMSNLSNRHKLARVLIGLANMECFLENLKSDFLIFLLLSSIYGILRQSIGTCCQTIPYSRTAEEKTPKFERKPRQAKSSLFLR